MCRLPEADELYFQYTLGQVVDDLNGSIETTDQTVARALVRKRLSAATAGSLGAVYDGAEPFLEAGGDWFGRYHRLSASTVVGG